MIQANSDTTTSPWMQRVLDEHRQLRLLISEIREFLGQPRPAIGEKGTHTWGSEFARKLVTLHDGLFRHFRYEERSGMAEDITMSHPRRANEVERLMAEHREILGEVKELMTDALDYSEGHLLDDPTLRTRLNQLLDRLAEHERAENDLVERSALQEVGPGD